MISVTKRYPSSPHEPAPEVQIAVHRIQDGRHVARVWVTSHGVDGRNTANFVCNLEDLCDQVNEAITKMDADTI